MTESQAPTIKAVGPKVLHEDHTGITGNIGLMPVLIQELDM
jgi:hypothetical protein